MPRKHTEVFTTDPEDPKLREQFKKFTQDLVRRLNLPWKAPVASGKPVQRPLSSMVNSDSSNITDSRDSSSSFTFSPEPIPEQALPDSTSKKSLDVKASEKKINTNHFRREKTSLQNLVTACIRGDLKSPRKGHAKFETARRERDSISFVAGKKHRN